MSSARRSSIILSTCFLAAGLGVGTWGANLPALGRRARLDESGIGLVLLCFAATAILAMNRAPWLMQRMGPERLAVISAGLFGLGMACVGLVSQIAVAALVAGFCGLSFGTLDVSMNSRAAALEAAAGRPVMSRFHAQFSGGTLVGALAYAGLSHAGTGSPAILALAGAAIAAGAVAAFTLTSAPPGGADPHARGASDARPDRQALVLGLLAFMIFMAEGAIMDWGAVYLVRVRGTTESLGATGYAFFAASMLLGRLVGDRANRILGPLRLFRLSMALVVAAMAVFLASGSAALAMAALAVFGLGMANVIPLIFSAAGRLGAGDAGRSLSRVLTMGYAGILLGPALIGFVAEASSLRVSLGLVLLGIVAAGFGGRTLR